MRKSLMTTSAVALIAAGPLAPVQAQDVAPGCETLTFPCELVPGLVIESQVELADLGADQDRLREALAQADADAAAASAASLLAEQVAAEGAAESEVAEAAPAIDEEMGADATGDMPEADMAEGMEEAPSAEPEIVAEGEGTMHEAPNSEPATVAEGEATMEEAPASEDETVAESDGAMEEAPASEPATIAEDGQMQADDDTTADVEVPPAEGATQMQADADTTADVETAPSVAATAGDDAVAETTTEDITDGTARSATEDFATSASGADQGGDDDRFDDFARALALGLGAVVVGEALRNGDRVVSNTGDRVVTQAEDGTLRVLRDDDARLRQPGVQVATDTFQDGSTRTTVTREDGSQIVTIRTAEGETLRRTRIDPDGTQTVIFDDTLTAEAVEIEDLPAPSARDEELRLSEVAGRDALREALSRDVAAALDRNFSLRQVRTIPEVRQLAPQVELDAITFATGSAAVSPAQADALTDIGVTLLDIIDERPDAVFLIEGHTDAVGDAAFNLALSDRRAETVALALTEFFRVPPENIVTQGYGETQLKVDTQAAEQANRRAVVRNITGLLEES